MSSTHWINEKKFITLCRHLEIRSLLLNFSLRALQLVKNTWNSLWNGKNLLKSSLSLVALSRWNQRAVEMLFRACLTNFKLVTRLVTRLYKKIQRDSEVLDILRNSSWKKISDFEAPKLHGRTPNPLYERNRGEATVWIYFWFPAGKPEFYWMPMRRKVMKRKIFHSPKHTESNVFLLAISIITQWVLLESREDSRRSEQSMSYKTPLEFPSGCYQHTVDSMVKSKGYFFWIIFSKYQAMISLKRSAPFRFFHFERRTCNPEVREPNE